MQLEPKTTHQWLLCSYQQQALRQVNYGIGISGQPTKPWKAVAIVYPPEVTMKMMHTEVTLA